MGIILARNHQFTMSADEFFQHTFDTQVDAVMQGAEAEGSAVNRKEAEHILTSGIGGLSTQKRHEMLILTARTELLCWLLYNAYDTDEEMKNDEHDIKRFLRDTSTTELVVKWLSKFQDKGGIMFEVKEYNMKMDFGNKTALAEIPLPMYELDLILWNDEGIPEKKFEVIKGEYNNLVTSPIIPMANIGVQYKVATHLVHSLDDDDDDGEDGDLE